MGSDTDPPPVFPLWEQYWRYVTTPRMLLDLVIIVPYYASLSEAHDTSSGTLTFLRSFRLLRMVRLLLLLNLQRNCQEFEEMLGKDGSD